MVSDQIKVAYMTKLRVTSLAKSWPGKGGCVVPFIDLDNPTRLVFEWGWLLATRANFAVFVLLAVVFVLGMIVPLPRLRGER